MPPLDSAARPAPPPASAPDLTEVVIRRFHAPLLAAALPSIEAAMVEEMKERLPLGALVHRQTFALLPSGGFALSATYRLPVH